jgi:Fis family transcriptional regulator, factor for inversion stimulation protein
MKEKFDGLVEHLVGANVFLEQATEILERGMIRLVLERNGGNQCAAAKQLGIHRNTLQRKLTAYGLGAVRSRGRRKPPTRAPGTKGRKSGAA